MADLSEQRASVKFLFVQRKNTTEIVLKSHIAYKDDAMGKYQVHEWFSFFKNVKCRLMANLIVDVFQLPEETKISRKFVHLYKTVDGQLK